MLQCYKLRSHEKVGPHYTLINRPKLLLFLVRFCSKPPHPKRPRLLHGVMVMRENKSLCLMDPDDACKELGIPEHTLRFTSKVSLSDPGPVESTQVSLSTQLL